MNAVTVMSFRSVSVIPDTLLRDTCILLKQSNIELECAVVFLRN
jgi:hypothetical protein